MISSDAGAAFAALAGRLEAAARAAGKAQVVARALARRGDPVRWRRAWLLWPEMFGSMFGAMFGAMFGE